VGNVILVGSGNYAPVTVDGKSLTLFADTGATPIVKNLAAGQVVVLSGLNVGGLTSKSPSNDAGVGLWLRASARFVRVRGCEFLCVVGFGDGSNSSGEECCELPLRDSSAWVTCVERRWPRSPWRAPGRAR